MARIKYLSLDEMEIESARGALDFGSQQVIDKYLRIKSTCPTCKRERWIRTTRVRHQRETFTGFCSLCFSHPEGAQRIYLTPEDVKEEYRGYIDFDNQYAERGILWIPTTCRECGKKWNSRVVHLRHHYHTFTSLCSTCVNRGKNNPQWNGGCHKTARGYLRVSILKSDLDYDLVKPMIGKHGRVFEHRLIIAQHLGRALEPWEQVHHKNGVRSDNRIDNLEVVMPKQHRAITIACATAKKMQQENQILKARIRQLEQQIRSQD